MSLNPKASEWKPSFTAKEFVPSFGIPAQPAQSTQPATQPAAQSSAAPATSAPVRVLKLTETKPAPAAAESKVKETPITEEKPKVAEPPKAEVKAEVKTEVKTEVKSEVKTESQPAAASSKPKSAAATKEARQAMEKAAEKADAVAEDLNALDDEIVADLYGKEHLNVVFMGHVDAGKSTMGGNILYLTGMVDKRTMEKYEKEAKEAGRESWYLSWALDTGLEERAKGKTVECGRAYFETDKRRYTILDAPGHKNYVPSMISGASQADVGVMVISARKGEFETGFERGGQTREHTMLAKTSGISKMIIVINKMDDPTVEWDKARYDEIVSKLTPFLKQTGFNPKTDIHYMPVSGFTGANIKERSKACTWYSGPSLLEYLDDLKTSDRKLNAPLMIPIAEKYKDMGTIVVGKIESGHIKKNQTVLLMPNKRPTEVTTIYNETEDEVDQAVCGDNVRIRLKGVEEDEVSPGFVLCTKKKPVKTATKFNAQLAILEHKNIICAGYTAVLHVHSAAEEITLGALLHLIDKKTGRKSKRPPQFVKQGQKVIARIETTAPVCVETFEEYPQLGRFTLRDEGKTIAIGRITKVLEADE
ncbi:P-loop containing nucleoside triphosphate hydrolase protein [Halteromyces radiatus]|uniref:P-loop containing nucleoside triphosphate hydrolase protein n=1 Tax=Halteromyces radiatus TaxID=101107 RepID=UPI00221F2134|nr:P-loop containing nucleoside triphosphate hydrolase protein [Halteromyces radiatus]KAI8097641.1 P-loop containing nucleoside triphosphate hydrolase protein [Halteromyces radiatus]